MAGLVNWVTDKVSELVLGEEDGEQQQQGESMLLRLPPPWRDTVG